MNPTNSKKIPSYIKKEFDKIQAQLAPFVKKSMTYGMIAVPLILFSFFNLYAFISAKAINKETAMIIGVFALASAFGMALLKESLHQSKKMTHTSVKYMTERITKSDTLPEQLKDKYIKEVQMDQRKAYEVFYQFLQHEERIRRFEEN